MKTLMLLIKAVGGAREKFLKEFFNQFVDLPISGSISEVVVNVVRDDRHRLPMLSSDIKLDVIIQIYPSDNGLGIERLAKGISKFVIPPIEPLIESLLFIFVEEREYLSPQACRLRSSYLKRMSLLSRSNELTSQEFQKIWAEVHGPRVAANSDHLIGYFQDEVTGKFCVQRAAGMQIDGITQLWFANEADMEAVLPSKGASSVTGAARDIIGGVSTFIVEESLFSPNLRLGGSNEQ